MQGLADLERGVKILAFLMSAMLLSIVIALVCSIWEIINHLRGKKG